MFLSAAISENGVRGILPADFLTNIITSARGAAVGTRPIVLVLRAGFWLGLTICYLPSLPPHFARPHDRSAMCRHGAIARDKQRSSTSHDTLTPVDLAIPWQGRMGLRGLCKQQLERNVRE